jgi:hypothetical protein
VEIRLLQKTSKASCGKGMTRKDEPGCVHGWNVLLFDEVIVARHEH